MKLIKYVFCAFLMIFSLNICAFAEGADYYARVVLVGNYRSGKTSLWNKMFGYGFNEDEKASDMMCCKEFKENISEDKTIQINVWDTAGASQFYDEVVEFTRGANFVIIVHDTNAVFDIGNKEYLGKLYRDIYKKINSDGKIIIVGSKWDLRHDNIINANDQRELLEGVAKTAYCPCIFVSSSEPGDVGTQNLINYIKAECIKMGLYTVNPDSSFQKRFNIKKSWCAIL